MYLKRLNIRNFRYFRNYEIEFAPRVTVLFGKNGSGKTTLIHALHKALSFMMHSEKIKVKDSKTKKNKLIEERTLRGGNPYVSVEGFSKTGEANYDGVKRADYTIEIKAEANLDEQTPIEWAMSAYYIDSRLRKSEYKEAFNVLYNWHQATGKLPLLAYYSDGYPHYTSISKAKKEKTKESFLVKSSDESVGYTDWNSEIGCTNTWLVRLETKIRTIEYSKRRISMTENEAIRKSALEEIAAAEKEVNYIVNVLKHFSKDDEYCEIENIEISPYDAYLRIIDKNANPHSFRKLPAGYKRMYYIVLDLAYRSFFLANGTEKKVEGLVFIDEVDLHLHPELEQQVLRRFMETFPDFQFIVSTHSPLVLTGLETKNGDNIVQRLVKGTIAPEILHDVYGIDCNLMLEENMGVSKRNLLVQEMFDKAWESIGAKKIEDAKINVENLERITPADQPELVRLRSLIKRLEVLGK